MIIAFSGLDGSGKTTQLDLAADYLRKKGITCRRRHAIRDSLAYFLTHRMLGRVSPGSRESLEKGLRRGGNKVMFPVLSAAKKFFLLLDAVYFRLRYGYYRRSKKKTILCDRYFYDEAIQARYLRISGGAFQGIYEALTVKPDVAFLLETESGEAYARKDEYDPEYFRAKSSLYDDYREKGLFVAVPSRQIPETRKIIEKYIDRVITGEFVK